MSSFGIVAFGTDLPELFISITGAIQKLAATDTSDLIVGQTIGSSISQIALMFGVLGLITVVRISKKELFRDGLVLFRCASRRERGHQRVARGW